jgi:chromosomal replication initiation ATPase DnaA
MKIDPKEQSGIGEVGRKAKSVEEIAAVVAKAYIIKEAAALYVRRSNHREARSVFIELCRRYLSRKISISELGRRIGNISGAAIWINRKRLEEAMKQHKGLLQQFESLEKELQG